MSNHLGASDKRFNINLIIFRTTVFLFLFCMLILGVLNTLVVQQDEIIIVKKFGSIVKIIDQPGIHFKMPFLHSTSTLTKRLMRYNATSVKAITQDNKSITVDSFIVWKVNDADQFIKSLQSVSSAEVKIDNAIYSVLSSTIGMIPYKDIIMNLHYGGHLNHTITQRANDQLKEFGILVYNAGVLNIGLVQEYEDYIYKRMKSEREKIADNYINQGEIEATHTKAEADKQVKILLSKAFADAEKIKGKADADASLIYARSYNKDPEFYKFYRTLESYKKTLKGKTTIILPHKSPYLEYFIR